MYTACTVFQIGTRYLPLFVFKNYKFGFQRLHNTSWIILWLHFKTNISCLKIWQYLSMNISAVMNLFTSFSVHLKMIPCCYLIYIIHVVDTVFLFILTVWFKQFSMLWRNQWVFYHQAIELPLNEKTKSIWYIVWNWLYDENI